MAYTCTYCKTGVMNTSEQYQVHINGTKHKKKAFQLQAPDDGIEYDEFKKKKFVKATIQYVETVEDFPSLSSNTTSISTGINYKNITKNYTNNDSIVVHESIPSKDDDLENDEFVTIDEVFYKTNSRIESAKHLLGSYIKNNKTAAQALNEIAEAMLWKLDFEPVLASNFRYGIAVLIDGIEFTIGEGESKKEAKQNASSEALNAIKTKLRSNKEVPKQNLFIKRNTMPTTQPIDSIADSYKNLVNKKIKELESISKNLFVIPKRYAAFIITERVDQLAKDGTVVAFAAGDRSRSNFEDTSMFPGYYLKNLDALVLAKRSLQCFFYNQMLLIFDKNRQATTDDKVYFEFSKNGFLKLKNGCRLHLYLSHAPKGDCIESIPPHWKEPSTLPSKDIERDRNGIVDPIMFHSYTQVMHVSEPGHIRVLDTDERDRWVSLVTHPRDEESSRNITMSPTDKLMAWIHLGIQGAMLSHLMNPIYLYSIQFGKKYVHEHIARALLCRVPLETLQTKKGTYYKDVKFQDPYLERVSEIHDFCNHESDLDEDEGISLNWYENPVTNLPEIINGNTGCIDSKSPYQLPGGDNFNKCSRLSKVCMLIRLKNCISNAIEYFLSNGNLERAKMLKNIDQFAKYNYSTFKRFAIDYRQLKQCLFESLNSKHYGEWLPNIESHEFNLIDCYSI